MTEAYPDTDAAPRDDGRDRWHRDNDAYLGAALHWLRLRLRSKIDAAPAAVHTVPVSEKRAWRLGRRKPENPPLALPPGRPLESSLEEATSAMADAEAVEPPPALVVLARRLGLSRFERDVLLLCAAADLDTSVPSLCAEALGDPNRPHPTFALALTLFDDPAWEALSPQRPLRYWRLIEISQPEAEPLTTSALRADERVVNYLKGINYLDDRLVLLLGRFDAAPSEPLPPSQEAAAMTAVSTIRRAVETETAPVIQLVGADSVSKQLVAQRAAAALGLVPYRLPLESLPRQVSELETLARLWQRESLLLPLALFIDAHDGDGPAPGGTEPTNLHGVLPLQRFLGRSQGLFLLSAREVRPGIGAATHAVEVAKPTLAEQREAWADMLGERAGESPALLAGQFDLNAFTIRQVARTALADTGDVDLHDRAWKGCLVATGPRMDRLAQRLEPLATWEDIVLPEEELDLLRRLAGQVAQRARVYDDWGFRGRMNRGLGINALFAGESGTGKTMAAEVIANELGLHLYRIDLSAVVSKYIGETEKNLGRLFDAADGGGGILFFDEADALFGKRSEVRDSHDRYANIEINYLLQRMEAYRGLAILATNMRSALDEAFMRRLRFVITFPFPGVAQREAIWRRAWPSDTPLEALDHARLARLNLTGGAIANVAVNSAFMAAEQGTEVTMPLVLAAARAEYQKLDRPIKESHFRCDQPARAARLESQESRAEVLA